jgi:hypothetical protein
MGLYIATLFILYAPLLLAYRGFNFEKTSTADAVAAGLTTLLGLWLLLGFAMDYRDMVLSPNKRYLTIEPTSEPSANDSFTSTKNLVSPIIMLPDLDFPTPPSKTDDPTNAGTEYPQCIEDSGVGSRAGVNCK